MTTRGQQVPQGLIEVGAGACIAVGAHVLDVAMFPSAGYYRPTLG